MVSKNADNFDYFKDERLSTKRIGESFRDCMFEWKFPTSQLTPKNDSILVDIEYSFDGIHVAGRLKKGSDEEAGGDAYNYGATNYMKMYFRIAPDEYAEDHAVVPYRLWVMRSRAGG